MYRNSFVVLYVRLLLYGGKIFPPQLRVCSVCKKLARTWLDKRIKSPLAYFLRIRFSHLSLWGIFFSHFHALFRVGLKLSSLSNAGAYLLCIFHYQRTHMWAMIHAINCRASDCSSTLISRRERQVRTKAHASLGYCFFHPMQQVRAHASWIQIARCNFPWSGLKYNMH